MTTAGRPVVGARVVVLELHPELSATTDGDGRYSIPGVPTSSFWDRTLVRVSQPGYFTDFKRRNIQRDTQLDVALDPLAFIPLGELVRGTVRAGEAMCAGKDYEEEACQRFAVVTPAEGTVEVTLTSPEYLALDVVTPDGDAIADFADGTKRMRIPARPGGIYEIRVLTDRGAQRDFELIAMLR